MGLLYPTSSGIDSMAILVPVTHHGPLFVRGAQS